MKEHAMGQNPLMYAALAAVFTAVMIFLFFYTRRMRSLGDKNHAATQNTPSEIVRELRSDGTKIDASTTTKEQ